MPPLLSSKSFLTTPLALQPIPVCFMPNFISFVVRLKEEWDTQYEKSQRITGIHRRAHDLVNCILEVPFANESIWSHGVAD